MSCRPNLPRRSISWLFLLVVARALAVAVSVSADEGGLDFNRDIRPVLSDKCFGCHGPDEQHREADLRLDLEESAKADRGGYQAVVPGKPQESELIARVDTEDEDLRMPPADSGKALSKKEIERLRLWIERGAAWSAHWAYVPPKKHPAPQVKKQEWPINWIDRFVLARLESEALQPSVAANRTTLIRRLHFDLIGLPPSPEAVDEFTRDTAPQAYENLVDQLLDSEHYGERMAMYWLDLVRYADTVGYHGDQDHSISPYRDWVIDALNENMPFDQFTREQLAGDLLPDASTDQKIATGYNRLLQTSHEGGVQPGEYLVMYAADRVRNVSAVWLGATMGCAQCHDHKFDPYTTKDFYAMAALFADVDEAQHFRLGSNALPTRRPPEIKVLTRRERQRIDQLEKAIAEHQAKRDSLPAGDEATGLQLRIAAIEKQRDAIRNAARTTMITVAIKPRTVRILPRGNWLDESGPIVSPAVPEFLGGPLLNGGRATRLDLARWLTDAEKGVGGLTARVLVNRLWYLLFGVGIAGDLDDFGGQGQPPVHPELLDNLAIELIGSRWDVKHMMKLLVTSRTYRQSSQATPELRDRDPDNRLYARQSRFRLPGELVRDNVLAISGLLVKDVGGASVKPYQPAGCYRHLNFPKRTYEHHADQRQWRRGVYVHWQRQFLHPMLKAFDAPRREECMAQRPRSNTPLAALVMLNDPTFVEAARVFAERIVRDGGETSDNRLDFAYRLAVSRKADGFERNALKELFGSNLKRYRTDAQAARALISTGQAPVADDLDAAELAAWTAVARAVLNMSETIIRN